MAQKPTAYIVDDDHAVRDSIRTLLECEGFTAHTYASSGAFLQEAHPDKNSCLVVNVHMSGMSGLELLDQLQSAAVKLATIVMTAKPDATIRSAVHRAGAMLLEKPFRADELVSCIKRALGHEED